MATEELGLPAPKEIKALEAVVPGISAEFLALVRHKRRVEDAKLVLAFIGPVFGLIVVLSCLAVSGWLINGGHGTEGTLLGVVDIVSLAGVFVLGSHDTSEHTQQPAPAPEPVTD